MKLTQREKEKRLWPRLKLGIVSAWIIKREMRIDSAQKKKTN